MWCHFLKRSIYAGQQGPDQQQHGQRHRAFPRANCGGEGLGGCSWGRAAGKEMFLMQTSNKKNQGMNAYLEKTFHWYQNWS